MFRNILASSRYLIIIAVVGSFLASLTVLIYDFLTVVNIIIEVFAHHTFTPEDSKRLAFESIEMIDLFLLGAVLYIISLGLYELFIDSNLPTPSWLVVTSLNDLKSILIGVVAVLLAVTFLGFVVTWDGNPNILALGISVGLVLLALSFLLGLGPRRLNSDRSTQPKDE
ncbi:MAG TPA: YqhA family protein [Ktedonobacteraceae bacterium]|nr:YqhA family protein [Ktedonobacteraceae bacterium]